MDALFQPFEDDPAILFALIGLFVPGILLVVLSISKEIRRGKIFILVHSSVWTRLGAAALGLALIGAGTLLAIHSSGGSSGGGDDDSDLGTPERVDFTIGAGPGLSDRCRDLDQPGAPLAVNAWFGLCGGGNEIDVHRGYGLFLWEEDESPTPLECVDLIGRHGVQVTAVAVGSTLCVTTRENRVAVLTVESMDGGIVLTGDNWGPLVY